MTSGFHLPILNVNEILYHPMSYDTVKNRSRFDDLSDLAYDMDSDIDIILDTFGAYIGAVIVAVIKKSIETQKINKNPMRFKYKQLSKAYKKRKNPIHSDDFWVNTEFLLNNIKAYRGGTKRNVYVGFPKNIQHPNSGTELYKIVLYMENGTRTMPARPLLKPSIQTVAKKIDLVLKNFKADIYGGKVKIRK